MCKAHRILYETIAALYQQGRPYDAISVLEVLKSTRQLEQIGGKPFPHRGG